MPPELKDTCLRLMTQVLRSLRSAAQPEEVYHHVVDLVQTVFHCQACAVVLIDPATEYLKIETNIGISHLFQKSYRKRISTGPIGRLMWEERPIIIPHHALAPDVTDEVRLEHAFGSCACLPMSADHRTVGYLYVALSEPHEFADDELFLLQACADCAALAMYKNWLVEENLRLERIDHETGLEHYSAFQERLMATMERAIHFHEPFALILGDVDNFKTLSHTYGYTASKNLLRELSNIVRQSIRSIDGAARFGFDEFVLLRSNAGLPEAFEFAESLRQSIASAEFTPDAIKTTVSIGLAVHPANGMTPEELLLTAKKALFQAQRSGRDKVVSGSSALHMPEEQSHSG